MSRMSRLIRVLVVLSGVAAIGAAALRVWWTVPDRVEPVGPFAVVTHTTSYLAGWNEGQLRRATTEHYALRYRDRPFAFEGKAGLFRDTTQRYTTVNAVITFPAAEPVLLVNVGDPNNRSFFYLVREVGGAARAELVGEGAGGVAVDWLTPVPNDSGARQIAVHRKRLLPGGRWLLVGDGAVLDTRTLAAHAITAPPGVSLNTFARPIAISPDERSVVRFGYLGDDAPAFAVTDFTIDSSYALPIDRATMRYGEWEELDAAWLDHHFSWQRTAGGHDRLARRPAFAPLPYRGRLSVDQSDGYREYQLLPVKPAMREQLAAFLVAEMQGERFPADANAIADSVRVQGRTVHVLFADEHVGVFMARGSDTRLVAEIARRFDAALRGGAYDRYFLP
jgi:hypothetical protein